MDLLLFLESALRTVCGGGEGGCLNEVSYIMELQAQGYGFITFFGVGITYSVWGRGGGLFERGIAYHGATGPRLWIYYFFWSRHYVQCVGEGRGAV